MSKRYHHPRALFAALLCLGACTVDDLALTGRPCSHEDPCGPGTYCSPPPRTCIPHRTADAAVDAPADDRGPADADVDRGGADLFFQDLPLADAKQDIPCPAPCPAGLDCVAGTCACLPGGSCSGCCEKGSCIPLASQTLGRCGGGGTTCVSCDDALACTVDSCSAGACLNKPTASTCNIGKVCYQDKAIKPGDACWQCQAAVTPVFWTLIPAPGCVTTLAGSNMQGYLDGPAKQARFKGISGVAVDKAGKIYVADTSDHRIRVVLPGASGATVATVAGTGNPGFKDGPAKAAMFNSPVGLTVDAGGVIYVADRYNHRVRMITPGSGGGYTVSTLAGTGAGFMQDGPALTAGFNLLSDVEVNAAGTEVFVADTSNNRIRVLTKGAGGGWTASTAAGAGLGSMQDGEGSAARFNQPAGVALYEDATPTNWTLFVADRENNRVRRLVRQTVSGVTTYTVTTYAGSTNGYQNGQGATARFSRPMGVAMGKYNGDVYVADNGNWRLRFISGNSTSILVSALAGTGVPGYEDGKASLAQFTGPGDVVLSNKMAVMADYTRIRTLYLAP